MLALSAAAAVPAPAPATATATPLSACIVSAGALSFDLTELGAPAVLHRSRDAASLGWSYFFSACGDVPQRSVSSRCGAAPRSAALQETQAACHSLGTFVTRNVSVMASGISIAFSGGDGGRSTVVEVECVDVPRRLVTGWEGGTKPLTYVARVRARAGCALSCARDPITVGGHQAVRIRLTGWPDSFAACGAMAPAPSACAGAAPSSALHCPSVVA